MKIKLEKIEQEKKVVAEIKEGLKVELPDNSKFKKELAKLMAKYSVSEIHATEIDRYETLLEEFIDIEGAKTRIGSGDDAFYEMQIGEYVNKQRKFWITFIKFIEDKLKVK